MPTPIAPPIILAQKAQVELHTLARAHTTPQSLALRARMVLRAAAVDQPTNLQIGRELGCSNLTVGKWRRRYLERGFPSLQDAPRSGRPRTMAPATRVQVLSVVSATVWKRTKTGKTKMVRFSGIKFAAGLAYETHNPIPSHEIRRTRIRRQIFATDAKKKIVPFQIAGIDTVSGHR